MQYVRIPPGVTELLELPVGLTRTGKSTKLESQKATKQKSGLTLESVFYVQKCSDQQL